MTGKQVIATWHTLDEMMPPEDGSHIVTFSGNFANRHYHNSLGVADYWKDRFEKDSWEVVGLEEYDSLTIQAWADLEPYRG